MELRQHRPAASDLAVIAKTGKRWDQWFRVLDRAGAARMEHKDIVRLLGAKYGIGPWWRQMVAAEYERARGLGVRNRTAVGYSVSVSRTVKAAVSDLYAATSELRRRRKWFPRGALKLLSRAENAHLRGAWNRDARLEISFFEKPDAKAQIVVELNRLRHEEDVERERAAWRRALFKLSAMVSR